MPKERIISNIGKCSFNRFLIQQMKNIFKLLRHEKYLLTEKKSILFHKINEVIPEDDSFWVHNIEISLFFYVTMKSFVSNPPLKQPA